MSIDCMIAIWQSRLPLRLPLITILKYSRTAPRRRAVLGSMKSGLECHPNPSSTALRGGGESGVMNEIHTDSSVESKT